jgi:hypothetical protein
LRTKTGSRHRLPFSHRRDYVIWTTVVVNLCCSIHCGYSQASRTLPQIEVYKTPSCDCCARRVNHLRDNGFAVRIIDVGDLTYAKTKARVPRGLYSCHTAFVGGPSVERYMPATDIRRLLQRRPSCGWDHRWGNADRITKYGGTDREVGTIDVVTFDREGRTAIFSKH